MSVAILANSEIKWSRKRKTGIKAESKRLKKIKSLSPIFNPMKLYILIFLRISYGRQAYIQVLILAS